MRVSKYILICCLCLVFVGCTKENAEQSDVDAQFTITTRVASDAVAPDAATQLTRLYIGERKPEHNAEDLHCNRTIDVGSANNVHLTDLYASWYKFVFLTVPHIEGIGTAIFSEETPGANSCDMAKMMVDYEVVLNSDQSNGDVFRKVINRWVKNAQVLSEDVILNRLNGQLVIDMGVPEDQFEKQVAKIKVVIEQTPTKLYILDNDKGEIVTTIPSNSSFSYESVPQWGVNKHHLITINLLPSDLQGYILVVLSDGSTLPPFSLKGTYEGDVIKIKQNTRTKLEFNGVHKDYFDVKYAGCDNSQVGVDDDDWDGWQ